MALALTSSPHLVLDCRNKLGESILWDDREQVLWWANIHDGQVWKWDPFSNADPMIYSLSERVGAIALRRSRGLTLALASGFAFLDLESGAVEKLTEIEADLPSTRLNDGRVDAAGRFVCGGMDEASPQQPLSAVYSLEKDRSVRKVLGNIHCSNSICWTPDGASFYFTDMPTQRIDVFDYDIKTGTVGDRKAFVSLEAEPGLADGSVVDAEGYLWNAQWGGGKIVRYAPNGTIDRDIELPVSNPTCLTFGGPDLDTLFITSAWFGLDDKAKERQPQAGGIFALKPGVKGNPEHRYAG